MQTQLDARMAQQRRPGDANVCCNVSCCHGGGYDKNASVPSAKQLEEPKGGSDSKVLDATMVISLTLKPGVLGMEVNKLGRVQEVFKESVAEQLGIQAGWKCTTVDGEPFDLDLLTKLINGKHEYTANFQTSKKARPDVRVTNKLKIPPHTGIFKLHLEAQASLNTTSVREAVKLPDGIDRNEWIACQVLGIYDEVIQLMSLLDDMCTNESCPIMNAGKHVTYSWNDENNPTPTKLPAPEYMKELGDYAYRLLSDRAILPIDGTPFSSNFEPSMKTLLRRFFRVYAHTYLSHFKNFRDHGVEAHLNCCFKRFLFFVTEFDLLCKDDMLPLKDLIQKFLGDSKKKTKAR